MSAGSGGIWDEISAAAAQGQGASEGGGSDIWSEIASASAPQPEKKKKRGLVGTVRDYLPDATTAAAIAAGPAGIAAAPLMMAVREADKRGWLPSGEQVKQAATDIAKSDVAAGAGMLVG